MKAGGGCRHTWPRYLSTCQRRGNACRTWQNLTCSGTHIKNLRRTRLDGREMQLIVRHEGEEMVDEIEVLQRLVVNGKEVFRVVNGRVVAPSLELAVL